MKRFIAAVVVGGVLAVGTVAWGAFAEQYTLTDIGPAERAGHVFATDVDKEEGTVIGFFEDSGYPRAIQLYPTIKDIGPRFSSAFGIDGTSIVGDIGTSAAPGSPGTYAHHPTLWQDGTARELEALPGGATPNSGATCINAEGDIWGAAGRYSPLDQNAVPVLWMHGLSPIQLPTFGGGAGRVTACNNRGDSAGESTTATGEIHCAFWPVRGGVVACHPAHGADESRATELNQRGQLVANARQDGRTLGYLWMFPAPFWLKPLPGDSESQVESINDVGDAVGQSCDGPPDTVSWIWYRAGTSCRASGWDNLRPIDLLSRTTNAAGWTFENAYGITNEGVIVVSGRVNGVGRYALLTPVETPVIVVRATPETLWPPTGRLVPVTVSGTITGAGVQASTAAYAVTDEYGQVQPKGSATLRADGSYSFSILLQASRQGNDKDGRQYIITVSAQNTTGTKGSAATGVRVPHDQGRFAATQ